MNRRHLLQAAVGTAALQGLAQPSAEAQTPPPFKLRYGPRIGWLSGMTVIQQVELYHRAGFACFEHNGLPGMSMTDVAALRKRMDELNMSMGTFVINRGGWRPTALPDKSCHAKFFEDVKRGVEYHNVIKNEVATVTSGLGVEHLTFAQQTSNCIEALKRAAEMVEKTKLVLVLEPLNHKVDHAGYFVEYSEHAAEIIGGVNHPQVRILFDIYHQQISEGNLINNITQYFDFIGYYQTGDVPGRKEPGTGETNYQNVFKALYKLGYKGILGLEHSLASATPEGFQRCVDAYRQCDAFEV